MTGADYIAALKKELRGLDRHTRNDIIQEIKSHFEASRESEAQVISRFGSPQELAQQYLDEAHHRATILEKVKTLGRGLVLTIGAVVLVLIAVTASLLWCFGGDDFDYADEGAHQLDTNAPGWRQEKLSGAVRINAEQSTIALYWHAKDHLRWRCSGRTAVFLNNILEARHAHCLIFLPETAAEISARQAEVIVVRPQASASIDLHQSRLRLAENGGELRLEIDARDSDVEGLVSDPNASIVLMINVVESQVELYEFE